MVAIPRREQQVQLQTQSPVMETNVIGQALEQGLDKMASSLARMDAAIEKKDDEVAERDATLADAEYTTALASAEQEAILKANPDGSDYLRLLDEARSGARELAAGKLDGAARSKFEQKALRRDVEYQVRSYQGHKEVQSRFALSQANTAKTKLGEAVLTAHIPVNEAVEKATALIKSFDGIIGQELANEWADDTERFMVQQDAEMRLNAGYDGAQAVLEGIDQGAYAVLGADEVDKLRDRASRVKDDSIAIQDRDFAAVIANMRTLTTNGEPVEVMPISVEEIMASNLEDERKAALVSDLVSLEETNEALIEMRERSMQENAETIAQMEDPSVTGEVYDEEAVRDLQKRTIVSGAARADADAFISDPGGFTNSMTAVVDAGRALQLAQSEGGDVVGAHRHYLDVKHQAQIRKSGKPGFNFIPLSKAGADAEVFALLGTGDEKPPTSEQIALSLEQKRQLYGQHFPAYMHQVLTNDNMPKGMRWALSMDASPQSRSTLQALRNVGENKAAAIAAHKVAGGTSEDIYNTINKELASFGKSVDPVNYNAASEAVYARTVQLMTGPDALPLTSSGLLFKTEGAVQRAIQDVIESQGSTEGEMFLPNSVGNDFQKKLCGIGADYIAKELSSVTGSLLIPAGMSKSEYRDRLNMAENIKPVVNSDSTGINFIVTDDSGIGVIRQNDGMPLSVPFSGLISYGHLKREEFGSGVGQRSAQATLRSRGATIANRVIFGGYEPDRKED